MTENIPMPDDSIVPTQNGYGWTSTVPNQVTLACVDWIRECSISSPFVLDIGAGLGVGTLPLLEAGARVTAIDLDEKHLATIRDKAKSRSLDEHLSTLAAEFPSTLRFAGVDAIHCSNMLHFLCGRDIEDGAGKMFDWLNPGGKVFLQVGTIYAGHIKRLLPLFNSRQEAGVPWAGETDCAKDFVAPEFQEAIPSFMNFLDGASLLKCFGAAGFTVDQGWYYTRYGLPDSLRNDGREHYGLIATKGKTSS